MTFRTHIEHGVIAFWRDEQARCGFAHDLGMKGWHCGEMGMDDLISHTIEHRALALRGDEHERGRLAYNGAWRDGVLIGGTIKNATAQGPPNGLPISRAAV